MSEITEIRKGFHQLFGAEARVFRAPGRVNLIGEHTDYNDGFVMPAAIDFFTFVAAAPTGDRTIKVRSEHFPDEGEIDLDTPPTKRNHHWSDYPLGVAVKLEESGRRLHGANLFVRGDVPIGSGLSSSAAIEVSTALALLDTAAISIDRLELARICQKAENEFVGIRTGLMDQFIACFGRKDHAVMLDCRSLESTPLRLPGDVKLVACNTMVKHELASSEYNARRAECEEGVRIIAEHVPSVRALRDVTLDQLQQFRSRLSEIVFKRCRHVVTENARVLRAADALRENHLANFGKLMTESHESLREDYEVSCKELDLMVELARHTDGVIGARMTGGGFGGCTINLVNAANVEAFQQAISRRYADATGLDPEIYVCSAADGAQQVV